ncbi:MAG: carboxypeptidase regulatory-like domain-containing protein [Deltaproteobacteria bacterium]|nr:carboxypeptidase regulatory-like domain-containing protein [Deltaproteobacteria bacterium]
MEVEDKAVQEAIEMTVRSRELTITVRERLVRWEPVLLFNVDKTEGYVGDTFKFYGWLQYEFEEESRPIPNRIVELFIDGIGRVASTTTDANGYYEFSWIPTEPGTYRVYAEAEVEAEYYPPETYPGG